MPDKKKMDPLSNVICLREDGTIKPEREKFSSTVTQSCIDSLRKLQKNGVHIPLKEGVK